MIDRSEPIFCMWSEPPPASTPASNRLRKRLEVAQPVVAELSGEGPRIEVEPCRLDVDHDAQPGGLVDRLAAHEVGMRDARAGRGDRHLLVDFFVGVEQGVHGPVADAVGRELQAGLDGRPHDRHQSLCEG